MSNDINILVDIIEEYGKEHQCVVAMEELSELIKDLAKVSRGLSNVENIAENIADVRIMLMQLELIFDCTDKVLAYQDCKLRGLRAHLNSKQGESVNE